ncbi:hypothetical protein RKD19_000193 [Streptomyces canus]
MVFSAFELRSAFANADAAIRQAREDQPVIVGSEREVG